MFFVLRQIALLRVYYVRLPYMLQMLFLSRTCIVWKKLMVVSILLALSRHQTKFQCNLFIVDPPSTLCWNALGNLILTSEFENPVQCTPASLIANDRSVLQVQEF